MDRCVDSRGQHELARTFGQIAESMGASDVKSAIKTFSMMLDDMDMQKPVTEDKTKDLEILTNSVNPIRLKNNPIGLGESVIYILYDAILK